jgi:ribosomal protein S18 acetylase RimI-like enzyme
MRISRDQWLAGAVGHDVFRVSIESGVEPAELARHVADCARGLYFVKLPVDRVRELRELCRAGFFLVETNLTFELSAAGAAGDLRYRVPGSLVRDSIASDHEALLEVAGSAFRYSRFHVDPLLERTTADRVKQNWLSNCLRGERGDRVFTALLQGRPAGMLASLVVEEDAGRVAVIDLVAVGTASQRAGLGRALVGAFGQHYAEQVSALRVGTQAANVPSVRLYESMGFSLRSSQYVAHLHVHDGVPVR